MKSENCFILSESFYLMRPEFINTIKKRSQLAPFSVILYDLCNP